MFCKECNSKQEVEIGDQVPQKEENYYCTCKKGHIFKKFIPEKLFEAIQNKT